MGKKQQTRKVQVKQLRKEVQEKLAVALADYKKGLPEEKYSKMLKKASKLVASNYKNGKKRVEKKAEAQVKEPVQEN